MSNTIEHNTGSQLIETLQCGGCRKRWQIGWMEAEDQDSVEHPLTCDCGRVLKTVRTAEDAPPMMILQHAWGKTVAACLPAFAAGALYPTLPEAALLAAYVISWALCGLTFVDEDNSHFSALAGIAIWSLAIISAAAGLGALAGSLARAAMG